VFIFAGGPLGSSSHDDLDRFDGITDLDRTIEDCRNALEHSKMRRAHARGSWRSTWHSRDQRLRSSAATCRAAFVRRRLM